MYGVMQAPQFRFRICSSSQKIHLINLQSLSFLIASPKQPLFLSLSLHSPFWTFHKNGIYTVQDCIYLLLLNMVFELLPCCCMCQHFILFHCLTVSILWLARFTAATYPIMNRIGPDFCICECCCCEHLHASPCGMYTVISHGQSPSIAIGGPYAKDVFNFKKTDLIFQSHQKFTAKFSKKYRVPINSPHMHNLLTIMSPTRAVVSYTQ